MNRLIKKEYDFKYTQKELYWGNKPHALVVRLQKQLPKGSTVLDLGCGEGQNTIYLAKHGFTVTAVDISQVGIEKIASKKNIHIKTEVADILDHLKSPEKFDAIVCINILHFVKPKDLPYAIERIQSKTKSKGYNVIASFINSDKTDKQALRSSGRYFLNKKELQSTYAKWIMHFYKKGITKRKIDATTTEDCSRVQAIYQKP